jgi:hypothetical protein
VNSVRRCGWLGGLLAGLLLLTGCASNVTVHRDPQADLARLHRFYVERRLGDDHHLDEAIVQELQRLGFQASSGPLTMKPDGTDAIVTYTDRWEWDFKKYLIELTIDVRDARNDKPITTGRYYQPSVTAKAPPEMIREILMPLFGPSRGA